MEITEQDWSSAVVDRFSLQSGVSKQMGKLFFRLLLFQKSLLPSVDLVLVVAALVAKRL